MSTDQQKSGEIMLFGVRLVVDSMRKSVSLNNLSQYEHRLDSSNNTDKDLAGAGEYASADETVVPRSSSTAGAIRERKRGVPWTEDEHKLFLIGLEKVGKGDWRGISRNFVKTRTPTQVASHAQKYFLRRSNQNRRRRRSSLFDITTDTVSANPINDQKIGKNINGGRSQSPPASMEANSEISAVRFSVPETSRFPAINNSFIDHSEMKLVRPLPVLPVTGSSSKSMAGFDLNQNSMNINPSPLSLNLSLSMSSDLAKSSSSRHSAFQVMQGFNNGDGIISVA